MRLLWIINIPLPPLCEHMGWEKPVTGGWLYSSFKKLKEMSDIKLYVATPYSRGGKLIDVEIDGVQYFAIPYGYKSITKTHSFVRDYWKYINEKVKPDIVHIHGTEYAHGNDYVHACGGENVVVSVQGLVSVISSYYLGEINKLDIWRNMTLRDILRKSTIFNNHTDFKRRGKIEIDTLCLVKNIIGRTRWDESHVWAINPNANYFHCDETLRDAFYIKKWTYEKCEPHSIFISQSGYPIKGLHIVLHALQIIVANYPDTKVYVAGTDITRKKPWFRFTGYGKYIRNLIRKLELSNYVEFTGALNEEQMCERYLNSNLFICSSCIENSPNSLGEAQLLGVPVLASYAGGIPDMMQGNEDRLYRYDDAELLANMVCKIFESKGKATPPNIIRTKALLRHSSEKNINTLVGIYQNMQNRK